MLHKDQRGSHIIAIVLVFVVLGVIGFAGFKIFTNPNKSPNSGTHGKQYQALQSCSANKQPLIHMPADDSKLEQIAPLGSVDPPGHTLPTDHMYMMYPYGDSTQQELYAPADIVVADVTYSREIYKGTDRGGDYKVGFYPCSELRIVYGHVDTLNDKIKAAIGTPEAPGSGDCQTNDQSESKITNCMWDTDVKLSAGELFGTANGWDLWATYEGSKGKVADARYYHNTDAVCPLDYWVNDLRDRMYAKIRRTAEPRCGEAYQDILGTLRGGWFAHKDPEQAKTDWSSHLSLSRHSVSNIGQLAVAGTIADQFMYNFEPKQSGTINVEPANTKVGTLYCYQHEGDQRFPNGRMAGTGKVLMKMTDSRTLQVEKQDGACGASESFVKPTTYYR